MDFFLNDILEDADVRSLMLRDQAQYPQAAELAQAIRQGERPKLTPGMLPLYVLAHLAPGALQINAARGIPRSVTVATLKDVNIWIANHRLLYGAPGVMEFGWLLLHYTGDLFRLGRLQFRMEKTAHGAPGEYGIETHIPQGEPLREADCLASFEEAVRFFETHFPQYAPECFLCHSWLLNPHLAEILREDSNIVRFMRLWMPLHTDPDGSAQAMERTFGFGFRREQLPEAPETTTLQRAMKQYLLSGGSLDAAAGYRCITKTQKDGKR